MPLTPAQIAAGRANDRIGTELVLETPQMRVWHLRLAPGEVAPPHRHDRSYFWTVLTDGRSRSDHDDGRSVETTYSAGDTRHFPDLTPQTGFVHNLTNIDDSEPVFVTVEFNARGDAK